MKITNEAVEAASMSLIGPAWATFDEDLRNILRGIHREALLAALPHLEGATPAIDRGALVALMNAHPIEAFNGSQVVCECNLTWVTNAEYRAHLADTMLALIGGQS